MSTEETNRVGRASRIYGFDFFRVIAICAVVLIHSSAPLLQHFDDKELWWAGNIFDSISRWCISAFIMLSGALLLSGKDQPISIFFKKRFKKVIVPFIAWSIIYLIYNPSISILDFEAASRAFLDNKVFYHLWFFYLIIGLYLITPILKTYVNAANISNIRYFVILWVIATPFMAIMGLLFKISNPFYLDPIAGFVGCFILGYYLFKVDINKRIRILMYILGFLGLVMTIIGTQFYSAKVGGINEFFLGYLRPNVLITAVAFFILGKYFIKIGTKGSKFLVGLSESSLGVYVIHPIILVQVMKNISILKTPFLTVPFVFLTTLVISFIVIYLLRKIPIIKIIVP